MLKKTIKTLLLRSEVFDLFVKAVSGSARKQAFADQPLHSRCCSNTRPPCSKNNALRAQKPMMAVRAFFSGAQRNGVFAQRLAVLRRSCYQLGTECARPKRTLFRASPSPRRESEESLLSGTQERAENKGRSPRTFTEGF